MARDGRDSIAPLREQVPFRHPLAPKAVYLRGERPEDCPHTASSTLHSITFCRGVVDLSLVRLTSLQRNDSRKCRARKRSAHGRAVPPNRGPFAVLSHPSRHALPAPPTARRGGATLPRCRGPVSLLRGAGRFRSSFGSGRAGRRFGARCVLPRSSEKP